ncbi:MAG TPA: Fe-S cluster assembly protein SufD [Geminicoccaceae bacterium]|nr:Fe-S cluster assembly protein SufD [Geminicoccus sp.]HMU48469.1 Fe-S cluster assembly protein SufD [Geminicoccaceae bacterium]
MSTARRRVEPVTAFAELWDRHRDYLPGGSGIPAWRQDRFAAFEQAGFPTPKVEQWKYTNVAKWANLAMGLAPKEGVGTEELARWFAGGIHARRLIFVNGHLMPELCHVGGLPEGVVVKGLARILEQDPARAAAALSEVEDDNGLTALNGAFATSGAWIELADGAALDEPLQLLFLTVGQSTAVMTNTRNVVSLGRGARLHLIESHVAVTPGHCLTNMVTQLRLGAAAELTHDRLELGRDGTTLINRVAGTLAERARLAKTTATLGGGLVRNDKELRLEGTRIEALLNGLYMPTAREHVDTQIRVHHHAPDCHSNQFYKGVVDGQSHAVFAGKIIVHKPAQKTDAFQTNNNLLLSDDAEIDTKPELEIYADDVKCSHGATVGDLDPTALFYLRSRGMPLATAKSLLIYGWAGEVIERMRDETLRAQARRAVLARLPGGASLDGLE